MNLSLYNDSLAQDIRLIENTLSEYICDVDDEQNIVRDAMRYSVSAGGKRIRPILVIEFCKALGGTAENALPFACALEMIHSYSLIHDDLPCMDDDNLRRGQPSCHIKFGESTALLAGDGLLTLAFHTITFAKNLNSDLIVKAVKVLSEYSGVCGMIGGQVIDLKYEGQSISPDMLNNIHTLKTGALLSAACELGAIAAGADSRQTSNAAEFGKNLGLAFQIIDDILDVVGNQETLGKPIGSDSSNEKTTYITLHGMDKAKKYAEEYTKNALNILSDLNENDFLFTLTSNLLDRDK